MRVVLITVLVLILALLGLQYWFGIRTEQVYNEMIEEYSQSETLTILSTKYEKGWQTSKAETSYALKNGDTEIIRLEETDTIYHGPVPIRAILKGKAGFVPVMSVIESKVVIVPVGESDYSEILKKLPPAELLTTVSLDDRVRTDITMPGVETEAGSEGEKLTWKGLTGVAEYGTDFKDVKTTFQSPGLGAEGKETILAVSGVKGGSNLRYAEQGADYPTGSMDFMIDTLTVKSKKDEPGSYDNFTLTNIKFTGTSKESAGTLDSSHSLGFAELDLGGYKYGPGGYTLAIRNIDAKSWKSMQAIMNESYQTEEQKALFMQELMKVLPAFISKSPEIEITSLSLDTEKGNLNGHIGISVDGTGLENIDIASNPVVLLTAIKADAGVTVSKSLLTTTVTDYKKEEISDNLEAIGGDAVPSAEELSEMAADAAAEEIDDLVKQNILVDKGDSYEINAGYALGQVDINGQPLDLGALLQD